MPTFSELSDMLINFTAYLVVAILLAALVALAVWIPPLRKTA